MFGDALMFVLTPMSWAFDLVVRLLSLAHALPVYLAVFFVGTVSRLFIRRWVGEASRESKARKRNDKSDSSEE